MVRPDQKVAPPQVRSPVMNSLHQTNELALICSELKMSSSKRSAEESKGSAALVEDGTKSRTRSIAIHHEALVEVRHLKYRADGEGALKRPERRLGVLIPSERVSPQETCKRGGDDPEVPEEFLVVAGQPEEAP